MTPDDDRTVLLAATIALWAIAAGGFAYWLLSQ
jgi:hypothetical protein